MGSRNKRREKEWPKGEAWIRKKQVTEDRILAMID
jgi:hypothetical protein